MMNLFAQATQAPNNGASNAEDFQPLTRNPQTTQGGLQPGTGPQSTSGQDILNKENTRIVVPVGDNNGETQGAQQQAPVDGGINWLLVVIVAAVIVAAIEYFFRRRERRSSQHARSAEATPQEVITVPADESQEAIEPEVVSEAGKPVPQKKKTSAAKKKSKSKSKSKRKKSRK